MSVQDQKVPNQGSTYMAVFWREMQLVRTKKKSSKEELMIWSTKMQARVQGRVPLKDSIWFKWVQIGS